MRRLNARTLRLGIAAALTFVGAAALAVVRPARAQEQTSIPRGYAASNFEMIGYSEIDGRPAFKLAIREVNGRWYLYMGHLWHRGWTIMDVTDPRKPQVVKFVPGPENTWTIQVDLHDETSSSICRTLNSRAA